MFSSRFNSERPVRGITTFFAAMKAGISRRRNSVAPPPPPDLRGRNLMRAAPLGRLSTILLPALALLAISAIAVLLWLPPADSAQAQTAQTVPSDWALIPDGIAPGDSFRLLFVTSASRDASSTDVSDYNSHAQTAAGNNNSLQAFKDQFRALISTGSVDAKTNTATTGTGVSVHWLGGEKVADDYADLYDGDWDSVSGKTEAGNGYTGLVWTGGNKAGQKSGQRYAGAAEVRLGDLSDVVSPLSSPNARASSETHPIYALSPVITVAQPTPANNEPEFASDTADRSVNEDAAIGTNVGEAVTATDADSDSLTYTVTGSDDFAINASTGQITVAGALDYETTPTYALTVSVSDGKDAAGEADTVVDDTIAVNVGVVNVDEAGTVSLNTETDPPQVGGALSAQIQDPDREWCDLELGAFRRQYELVSHRRREPGCLHAVGGRCGQVPASHRCLHRPPGAGQDRQRVNGQHGGGRAAAVV